MSDTPDPTRRRVTLPAVLDLRAAAPLASELLALKGFDVEIDGSEVRRLGGQCLQVLLSAHASWEAEGGTLRFVNLSPEFEEALSLLGAEALARGGTETAQ